EILMIDLKDCFFTISLHPNDHPKFAFSVTTTNKNGPVCRYHWVVLPQGMKNSPALCQMYIAWVLAPVRKKHPEWIIYHYVDDILIAGQQLECDKAIEELQ
ncbi:POK8 protein, partial [Chroicocephalus maculipennis]|nr:POK8 protein [Chroicocephalus maculipennis]